MPLSGASFIVSENTAAAASNRVIASLLSARRGVTASVAATVVAMNHFIGHHPFYRSGKPLQGSCLGKVRQSCREKPTLAASLNGGREPCVRRLGCRNISAS